MVAMVASVHGAVGCHQYTTDEDGSLLGLHTLLGDQRACVGLWLIEVFAKATKYLWV